MFPLNTVLFPGISVPLHVFEDRYRALVHALLRVEDPDRRLFGSVAIREGYEVGERGGQSLHRIGCLLQLVQAEAHPDGTFDIVARGCGRLRLDGLDTSGPWLAGEVEVLEDEDPRTAPELLDRARATFDRYREVLAEVHGEDVLAGELPEEPTALSFTLAATAVLTLRQRQDLLEALGAADRLIQVTRFLHEEIRTMTAMPSLPAAELARTGWCPN